MASFEFTNTRLIASLFVTWGHDTACRSTDVLRRGTISVLSDRPRSSRSVLARVRQPD
jgi:hypothetical protein